MSLEWPRFQLSTRINRRMQKDPCTAASSSACPQSLTVGASKSSPTTDVLTVHAQWLLQRETVLVIVISTPILTVIQRPDPLDSAGNRSFESEPIQTPGLRQSMIRQIITVVAHRVQEVPIW